jgi:FkbH-like protein
LSVGILRPDRGSPGDDSSSTDHAYFAERIRWQSVLSVADLGRRELLALTAPWPLSTQRIRVHRNHAVELALSVARPFLEFAGFAPEWILSEYDDSLSFSTVAPVDLEVIWLDYRRFAERMAPEEVADWLSERLAALRSLTTSPILVFDWDGERTAAQAFLGRLSKASGSDRGVRIANRGGLFQELGRRFFDAERAALTGTRMSAQGAVATARLLGARWIPALLQPRLKAVVVDLDNTLYRGVLAEDGADSLVLTEGHAELQRELQDLRDSGLFLGLLSRNDEEDVNALFDVRADFPLSWEHFDGRSIGWDSKARGLEQIASSLRIDPGAILFVDDNPGELLESALQLPKLRYIHATDDGYGTVRALRYFPSLWAFDRTETDALRATDVRAGAERERILVRSADDLASYYRELDVTLTLGHNQPDQVPRVAELSCKTNQFNLALSRYTPAEVQALLRDKTRQVSTLRLEDRLSDSGLIAMAVARRSGDTLNVEELCISCRALGRRLEDLMVAQMLVSGPLFPGVQDVAFRFVGGPRNQPARRWLEGFAATDIPVTSKRVAITVLAKRIVAASQNPDVEIQVV